MRSCKKYKPIDFLFLFFIVILPIYQLILDFDNIASYGVAQPTEIPTKLSVVKGG